jgi:hypothetical protein
MAKPYLTSNDLIEVVKRNITFPLAQVTYNEEDILSFANQEMFGVQVPTIMEVHEDYFTFSEDVPLKINKSRYDIPYRAIGLKLNDVYFVDQQGNMRELGLIQNTDRAFFDLTSDNMQMPYHYFIEANQICLAPRIGAGANGSIRFVYYLRPNNLVVNERAAICENFTKDVTISIASMVAGDTFTIGSTVFTADTDFAIGATDTATATNLNVAINTEGTYFSTVTANILTVRYPSLELEVKTSNATAFSIETLQGIEFDNVPENITNSSLIDFLKVKGGHRTYKIDVKLGKNAVSQTIIKFNSNDIPMEFEPGDYICSQYECIIPQIPSDLHNILAERTCARILYAQGDQEGLQSANAKISQMEARQNTMIDNRVDGSPRKAFNRGSLLRYGKGIGFNRTKI